MPGVFLAPFFVCEAGLVGGKVSKWLPGGEAYAWTLAFFAGGVCRGKSISEYLKGGRCMPGPFLFLRGGCAGCSFCRSRVVLKPVPRLQLGGWQNIF